MQDTTIYIRGLNYKKDDRDVEPGDCRVLENLYPTGIAPQIVWAPVPESAIYYQPAPGNKIKAAHAWQRNNLPALLVMLRTTAAGPDAIVARQIDNTGNIVADVPQITLWEFADGNPNRDAQFVQIGEHLIIAITESGGPRELLVASVYKNETICFPFNIPFTPPVVNITASDNDQLSKWFGFRFGYELVDGTIVRMTPVVFRRFVYSQPKVLTFSVTNTLPVGFEAYSKIIRGIAIFISDPKPGKYSVLNNSLWHHIGTITSQTEAGMIGDEIPDIVNSGSGYAVGDILTVSGGAGATIRVNMVSTSGAIIESRYLTRGSGYTLGIKTLTGGSGTGATVRINSLLPTAGNFEFVLQETPDVPLEAELAKYPQSEEDLLTAHGIYAPVLGSFNRLLLLGQGEYDFAKPTTQEQPPWNVTTKSRPEATSITYTPPLITSELYRIKRTCHLSWIKPPAATGVTIEMYFHGRFQIRDALSRWINAPEIRVWWLRKATNVTGTALNIDVDIQLDMPTQNNQILRRYRGHALLFRIRAEYADGVPSDWTYYPLDRGGDV